MNTINLLTHAHGELMKRVSNRHDELCLKSMRCVGESMKQVHCLYDNGKSEDVVIAELENSKLEDALPTHLQFLVEKCMRSDSLIEAAACEQEKSLLLLGLGLAWLHSDVYSKLNVQRYLMEEEAEMSGVRGISEILDFKSRFLSEKQNYIVDSIHEIDVNDRILVANFECLIPGKRGRGTEVIQFSSNWKVIGVASIRHNSVGRKAIPVTSSAY